MKLIHIRDVLAVAESGSLRSASRKLGITQPTITRSIREIEHEYGVALFTRHASGVTLTDLGRLFVRRAMAIQAEVRRIGEDLDQERGSFNGHVAIATTFSTSMALMRFAFPTFRKLYPSGRIRAIESLYEPIEADILSGDVDFYVGPLYEKPRNPSLTAAKLYESRRVIVARKGHPLLSAKNLAELQNAQWVRNSLVGRSDGSDVEMLFEQEGLPPPEIVVETSSSTMQLLSVMNSDLLTIMPPEGLEYAATSDYIEAISLDRALPSAPVCLVRRGDLPLTPLAERFSDMIYKAGLNYQRDGR